MKQKNSRHVAIVHDLLPFNMVRAGCMSFLALMCMSCPGAETNKALVVEAKAEDAGNNAARDYFNSRYKDYKPGFLSLHDTWFWSSRRSDERSSEKNFDNLSILNEDSRVDATIGVALRKEQAGEFRDALALYQGIIEKFPEALYRVSEHGVFVRAADYCQLRLLSMPPADLAFYRTQYDARAAEAYAEAERQCFLPGYQEIADSMLATSWGDKAMMALGKAALDAGRYDEAFQRFSFVKDFFSGGHCDTPELAVLQAYAAKKSGKPVPALPAGNASLSESLTQMKNALPGVTPLPAPLASRSPPYTSGGDYGHFPLTVGTPLLAAPVWKSALPAAWFDKEAYSSPVVTEDSVLIRHRNIIYCHSLLTGLLRWKNDMGGRVTWQNLRMLAFPNEELIVSDNMVYTTLYKGGPSLVALSLTTGELLWSAGPMSSTSETHIRYEAAPVVDGGMVYAGYVFDNIEGDTHFDTVYGMRAFDAKSGQLLWDRQISRLPTGKFTTNVGDTSRVKIRSFMAPPALKEGTLYYNTNAGTIAALDARTGRIKWLIRYPYYIMRAPIHDATEDANAFIFSSGVNGYGIDYHSALWSSQPPLVYNDCLYIAPVDSAAFMAIELATGKVRWSHAKGIDGSMWTGHAMLGPGYILGPTKAGEVIAVYGSRYAAATVLDAATGKIVWEVPDVNPQEKSLVLTEMSQNRGGVLDRTMEINMAQFQAAARPTLLADDTLFLSTFAYFCFGMNVNRCFAYNLATISIPERKVTKSERYYDAGILSSAETIIREDAPSQLKFIENDKEKTARAKKIMAEHVPDNPAGVFKPAAVVTAERFGTIFEVRVASDEISVVYDKARVEQFLNGKNTAPMLQSRGELALARSAYAETSALLNECLARTPPEQIAFREKIGGLFHSLDLHLAQKNLLRKEYPDYIKNAGLLLQTSLTLPQEIQSMLAVAEGYERTGDPVRAARILRNAIEHFGTREYSVSPLLFQQEMNLRIGAMVDQAMGQTPVWMYGQVFASALGLAKNAVPLHESVLSPADPTITINVGNLALARLRELARKFPEVASMLESESRDVFAKADKDEKEFFLRSFPGTKAGQAALDDLATTARGLAGAEGRRRAWRLADTAEKAGYRVPDGLKEGLPVAQKILPGTTITAAKKTQEVAFEGSDVLRLILPRRDTANEKKELVFVGGRARKRLDNKFTLECYDVRDGKKVWGVADLRLKGVGQEPGFFEAFVHHKMVIVHGLYDVLAFDIADGHLLWRYRVPMDFEINQVMLAGDLLILSGDSGTLALYAPTTSAVGDVVWQTKEAGGVYIAPYVAGDRLVLVRHAPDNVTVRHLGSGELIGRMELPGLSATTMLHPLLPTVSDAQSAAHAGNLLMLIDGWSYYMIDTQSLSVRWKREIDSNDPGVVPPMRIALNDKVAVITKKDYDRGSMYGIDVATGEILWKTEHGKKKEQDALPALYDICMVGDTACGITVPGNQRFQLLVFNPATGEKVAEWKASGYGADPTVRMTDGGDGQSVVLTLLQGQKLQTVAVNAKTANVVATVEREGVGPFGTHGFASAGVCDGHLLLLTKNGVSISSGE